MAIRNILIWNVIMMICCNFQWINAQCELLCSQTQFHICTGEKTFEICDRGFRLSELGVFTCPGNGVCVNEPTRCREGPNVVPVCKSMCGVCDPQTKIACLSKTDFAFCFQDNRPDDIVRGACNKPGEFCISNGPSICAKAMKEMATCESATIVIPPDSPGGVGGSGGSSGSVSPQDVVRTCQQLKRGGRFMVRGDLTCKRYNNCYKNRFGEVLGKQYECPGNSFFDCQTEQCSPKCVKSCMTV